MSKIQMAKLHKWKKPIKDREYLYLSYCIEENNGKQADTSVPSLFVYYDALNQHA